MNRLFNYYTLKILNKLNPNLKNKEKEILVNGINMVHTLLIGSCGTSGLVYGFNRGIHDIFDSDGKYSYGASLPRDIARGTYKLSRFMGYGVGGGLIGICIGATYPISFPALVIYNNMDS